MAKEELFLIYINGLGENVKGNNQYEFIFSNTIKDVETDGWDYVPALGQPEPPEEKFWKKIGVLDTEIKLDLIQDNTCFGMWHAIDGVIALAWEDFMDYPEYPEKIISFRFGEPFESVTAKLYERDLLLEYKKK